MAENLVVVAIPPGAVPIATTLVGTGTVYTPGAKRRLHITSLSISAISGGVGTLQFIVTPENGVAGSQPLAIQLGVAGQQSNLAISLVDLPTTAAVSTAATGAAATASFSLVGWEESTEK